ncbi:hypothetical protein GLYMA_06G111250v4 [Glycine max]|nr:hypothetical protein GYH30_014754 [Glycine max]KRH53206.2 hypothetical protein GLYMA_06G111250v4 [Glycine max]
MQFFQWFQVTTLCTWFPILTELEISISDTFPCNKGLPKILTIAKVSSHSYIPKTVKRIAYT